MSNQTRHRRSRRNSLDYQPRRRQEWIGRSRKEILELYPSYKTPPLVVLEILIELYNKEHTAREKEVSFKTREERAQFLRRFFRDLKDKAGFPTLPDPRNLGQRHIQAMVAVWQKEELAPATIQTYLSFLRGLALWTGKRGLVRKPAFYGLKPEQYKRRTAAEYDKSFSAHGIDIAALLAKICAYDPYVGAMLRLMWAFGLRRKEAIMLRPHLCVVPFGATGLPFEKKKADYYLRVEPGSKGGRERFIPIDTPERTAAIEHAKTVVATRDGHMGDPAGTLKQNMDHFGNMMKKFGITKNKLGVTSHGLRHEALINHYEKLAGEAAPIRGGTRPPKAIEELARQECAELAGHAKKRAAASYLGSVRRRSPQQRAGSANETEGHVGPWPGFFVRRTVLFGVGNYARITRQPDALGCRDFMCDLVERFGPHSGQGLKPRFERGGEIRLPHRPSHLSIYCKNANPRYASRLGRPAARMARCTSRKTLSNGGRSFI